jgi:hypothetical protein
LTLLAREIRSIDGHDYWAGNIIVGKQERACGGIAHQPDDRKRSGLPGAIAPCFWPPC